MGLLDHIFSNPARRNRSGEITYTGSVLTTTGGTLSTAAADVDTPLFSLSKVAAKSGRYLVTILDGKRLAAVAKKLTHWNFGVTGAADAAYTTAAGVRGFIRNDLINSAGTFEIQFTRTDTGADAEVIDGARIWVEFTVKKSSATP